MRVAALLLGSVLLAGVVLTAAFVLLPGCGVRFGPLGDLDFCPVERPAPAAETIHEVGRRAALEGIVRGLERRLATLPACPPPEPPGVLDTVLAEGGEVGEVNIVLSWQGTADLDLRVTCPSGAIIYYGEKRACGGALDVDANAGFTMASPVENIVFSVMPQSGYYEVGVNLYSYRDDRRGSVIPFTVTIIVAGKATFLDGTVDDGDTWWETGLRL